MSPATSLTIQPQFMVYKTVYIHHCYLSLSPSLSLSLTHSLSPSIKCNSLYPSLYLPLSCSLPLSLLHTEDYSFDPETLHTVFTPQFHGRLCARVEIVDDPVLEPQTEAFSVSIEIIDQQAATYSVTGQVYIFDNDGETNIRAPDKTFS